MPRYLDPKNDLIFYCIFGKQPHLAISCINELTPLAVETAELIHWAEVPHNPGKFDTMIGFKCSDNFSNQFFVDMQMQWVIPFIGRIAFINGNAYARQSYRKREYETNLEQTVYTLAFLNQIFDHQTEQFYHHYPTVFCKESGEAIPGYEIFMIELPKVKPENKSPWLRFLTEMSEETRELPPEILENEHIRQAAEICESCRFSQAEFYQYHDHWLNIWEKRETFSKLTNLTQEQITQISK